MDIIEAVEVAESAVGEAVAAYDAAVKEAGNKVRQAKSDANSIEGQRSKAVKDAEKAVRKAEKEQEIAIKKLERKIKSVEAPASRKIDSYEDIVLYADRVVGSGVEVDLSEDTAVEVAVNGDIFSYTSLLGGFSHNWYSANISDKRTLSLTINSPKGMLTTMGKPNDEKRAREFAALVRNTAVNAKNYAEEKANKISNLRDELGRVKTDTQAIDEARALLGAAKNDPASDEAMVRAKAMIEEAETALTAAKNDIYAIEMAQKNLDELKAQMSANDLVTYEEARTKRARKSIIVLAAIIAAIVLVIVIAIVLFG